MSKIETSTPWFEITFWLVQNIKSIYAINWLYPADNVSESSSWPWKLMILFFHHLEQRALKPPVTTEHSGSSWFILLRSISKSVQKFLNSS